MTRLKFDTQLTDSLFGTLTLLGTKWSGKETTVYFICQCPLDAPLAEYFNSWGVSENTEILNSISDEVESVDGRSKFVFFTRKTQGVLGDPFAFLCSTANRLVKELQHAEDCELSLLELDDQMDWINRHLGCTCEMPDFSRPRHA